MEAADEAEEEALEDHIEAKVVEACPKETVAKKTTLDKRNATSATSQTASQLNTWSRNDRRHIRSPVSMYYTH